jgi:hypothetical protein
MTDSIVPPKVSQYSAPVKQRRKADRNTNTIVTETLRNEPQPTDFRAMRSQTPVFTGNSDQDISTRPSLRYEKSSSSHQKDGLPSDSDFLDNDDMLDSSTNPAAGVKGSGTRFSGSSLHASSTLNEAGFPKTASHSSQAFATPLDFSGKPMIGEGRSFADDAPSAVPSQVSQSPGFQIYEDSQTLVSDGQFEDESVRENFTFRKPFPPSNSASKRITRKTSDKSLESGRDVPSRSTQRQSDHAGNPILSQSNKTPEISKYPFGSSPEFMNPPSVKVKRQYLGPHSRPGSSGQSIARPPSSPMPDPGLVARSGTAKRGASLNSQQTEEQPPAKRRAVPAAARAGKSQPTDESLPARSSQSVKDLPRVEDMNAGRNASKSQSSHMRSSGVSTRTTRNQAKASKGE